jgi:hypothetical protein
MAVLTTVGGMQLSFDPGALTAVADHDASTGAAVTCIYGIAKGPVDIDEPVDAFLARLGVTQKFAKLTRANGAPIWINGSAASLVRAPLPGEYIAGVNAVIFTGALTQGVTETPAAAIAALDAHGGKL